MWLISNPSPWVAIATRWWQVPHNLLQWPHGDHVSQVPSQLGHRHVTPRLWLCIRFNNINTIWIFQLCCIKSFHVGQNPCPMTPSVTTSSNGKHFLRYWPFVWGIHRWPVNFPHKGQWRGALICALNKRLSKQSWGWWFETIHSNCGELLLIDFRVRGVLTAPLEITQYKNTVCWGKLMLVLEFAVTMVAMDWSFPWAGARLEAFGWWWLMVRVVTMINSMSWSKMGGVLTCWEMSWDCN